MNGTIMPTVMELIEISVQRNTEPVVHGKVEERKGLGPSRTQELQGKDPDWIRGKAPVFYH